MSTFVRLSLALRQRLFGPEHPSIANSLHKLADDECAKGNYPEAERLFRQALAIEEKTLGWHHLTVGRTLYGLANLLHQRAEHIEVVLGEGQHSVKCRLSPTRNGLAYAGSVMGREIVYARSREQVQADIDRLNPNLRQSSRRR